jgi:hypothetical protein
MTNTEIINKKNHVLAIWVPETATKLQPTKIGETAKHAFLK